MIGSGDERAKCETRNAKCGEEWRDAGRRQDVRAASAVARLPPLPRLWRTSWRTSRWTRRRDRLAGAPVGAGRRSVPDRQALYKTAKMRPGKVLRIKGRRALSGLVGPLNLKNLFVRPDGKNIWEAQSDSGVHPYSPIFGQIRRYSPHLDKKICASRIRLRQGYGATGGPSKRMKNLEADDRHHRMKNRAGDGGGSFERSRASNVLRLVAARTQVRAAQARAPGELR